MSDNWRTPIGYEAMCRRANGRRKYHAIRQFKAQHRRIAIAKRLNELRREAWDRGGIPYWIPRGVRAQLAEEFQISRDTLWRDLKAIDRWDEVPPPTPPDPWFQWTKERARMDKRITIRLSSGLFEQLSDAVKAEGSDVSDIVRQALVAHLEGTLEQRAEAHDHDNSLIPRAYPRGGFAQ